MRDQLDIAPLSAVIPTRHRTQALRATLGSLAEQSLQPAEIIVVDASDDEATRNLCSERVTGLRSAIRLVPATQRGAATQRNQGVAESRYGTIAFFDDDILFEPDCVARLWAALESDPRVGATNATITNQTYSPPGRITRLLFPLLAGRRMQSYAGKVIGPGVNFLPEDRAELPEVVPVDWLNTTCTLYRREALPDPPFPKFFTGYSLCEDLTLSLTVANKGWNLVNARTARIYHDSQPGDHKRGHAMLSEMELRNRHFVMTRVLGRRGLGDYLRFALWEAFQVAAAVPCGARRASGELLGKVRGTFGLVRECLR